jgi:protein tyrosine/serine phosphatase
VNYPLRVLLIAAAIVLSVGLCLGSYAFYIAAIANFYEVAVGKVFRSAQLNKEQLSAAIQRHGIKSVLNLRGMNVGKPWYDDEITVCKQDRVVHYDLPLSAGKDVSAELMDALVAILKKAPQPLLIHCLNGADRAALGAAVYHLAVEGKPVSEANKELTIWDGHVPNITPWVAAMDRSFLRYAENHIGPVEAIQSSAHK